MVCERPKPRYSEEMESGVLYFVAKGKAHVEKYGGRSGNKYNGSSTMTHTTKHKKSSI